MVSTYKISHYLEGVEYPVSKQEIIKQAKKNKAPQDIVDALRDLPENNFIDTIDLWRGIESIV